MFIKQTFNKDKQKNIYQWPSENISILVNDEIVLFEI